MDEIKRAILGDHEAAKRLTEAGCWCRALSAGAQQREDLFLAEKRYVALSAALCLHLQLKRTGASYIWNGTPAHRF